jgi:hypothetical protein
MGVDEELDPYLACTQIEPEIVRIRTRVPYTSSEM